MVLGYHYKIQKVNNLKDELNLNDNNTHILHNDICLPFLNYLFNDKNLSFLIKDTIYEVFANNHLLVLTFIIYNKNSNDADKIEDFDDFQNYEGDIYTYIMRKFEDKNLVLGDNIDELEKDILNTLNKETLSDLYFYFYNLYEYYTRNFYDHKLYSFYYMILKLHNKFIDNFNIKKTSNFTLIYNNFGKNNSIHSKSLLYTNFKLTQVKSQDKYDEIDNIIDKISYLMSLREKDIITLFEIKDTFKTKLDLVTYIAKTK
jgi:hypothetical protein